MDALIGVIDRTGRWRVHAQKRHAGLCQILGRFQSQTGKILKKERGSVVFVPAGSQENPGTRTEHVTASLKVLSCDPVLFPFVREIEKHGSADQGFRRNLVESHPPWDDMGRSIQMGSHVVAEANRLQHISILLQALNLCALRP